MKLYGEISKTEELSDGTIKVYGYASSESVDGDGEIITAKAMRAALPDYLKFGAVREMHQPIAAGTAIEANVEDDGRTWFGAHIVDASAVKKVQTGVYKGFSIGGRVEGRDKINKNMITELRLIEISLVDRPCNPDAVFEMFKADGIEQVEVAIEEVIKAEEITTLDVTVSQDEVEATEKLADMLNKGEVSAAKLVEFATKAEPVLDIKKGMYAISSLACILDCIKDQAESAEIEAQYEGDNSPLPNSLKAWLAIGVDIFIAMAKEETDEMMSSFASNEPTVEQMVMLSAQIKDLEKASSFGDVLKAAAVILTDEEIEEIKKTSSVTSFKEDLISKAGSRHSSKDFEKIQKAHDHLADLGAKCMKADDMGDDSKKLAKSEEIEHITTLEKTIADLSKRLEEVEKQPAPILRPSLRVISKGEDTDAPLTNESKPMIEVIFNQDGSVNEAATVIKASQIFGGKPLGR